jgi:predicted nucleic acid-binding protein
MIAEQLDWASTYDAEYVALTKLQADAFVTSNAQLANAISGLSRQRRSTRCAQPETRWGLR